jgi:acyl-coenzyme A thioesterase PaaI-like protein
LSEPPTFIRAHHRNCLGCGTRNPCSLGLSFHIEGERVRSEVTIDERHEGAPGFAHGGAIATVLDDTLGTLLIVLQRPGVTANLEVNYRRPAFLHRRFELEAWTEKVDGRKLHLAAEMREDGEVVADARALFLEVSMEHFLKGGKIPEGWQKAWPETERRLPY